MIDAPLTLDERIRLAPLIIAMEHERINLELHPRTIVYIHHGLPITQESHAWLTLIRAAKATNHTAEAATPTRRLWRRLWKRRNAN